MLKAVAIAFGGLIVILSAWAGLLLFAHSEPSTMALDADLAGVRTEIKAADDEDAKYSGGVVKALLSIRREILRTTEAMLVQKRASFLHRIDLNYVSDGKPTAPATDERLRAITADLDRANASLSKDLGEAERYSGGLLQAMSLMTVASDRLSIAQLNLAYFGAKYGMVVPIPAQHEVPGTPVQPAPGIIVKDRDAF